MKTKDQTLDNFEGFVNEDPDNFFGEAAELEIEEDSSKDTEEKSTEKKKDEKKGSKKDSEKKVDTPEEEEDFFAGEDGDETDDEDDDDSGDGKPNKLEASSDTAKTLQFFKSKGLVDFEEDEEISDENSEDLLEEKIDQLKESAVKEAIQDLPDEVKNLIRYTSKGGNARDYFQSLLDVASSRINKDSDISDVKVQETAVAEDLKMQGYDDEYIETHIKSLKDTGKLQAISEKVYNKIVKEQEEDERERLKAIEEDNKAKKESSKKFKEDIKKFLNDNSEVSGYKLSSSDKRDFPEYISSPKVQLQNGKKITEFQSDLFKAMADKNKLVLLSKILKNDFDFGFVEKKAVSKDNKEKRKNIRNEVSRKGSNTKTKSKRPIWELID